MRSVRWRSKFRHWTTRVIWAGPTGVSEFAGWRRATAHVPAELLLPGENAVILELRSPENSGYRNRTFVREAVLELAYPPVPDEPDLSLPVSDLPAGDVELIEEPPLPPVQGPETGGPAGALSEFWNSIGGSL